MKKQLIIGLGGLSAVALAACAGGIGSRAGYETAPYRVLQSNGAFEVREYPVLNIVKTPMSGDDDSFMRLFRYIDGQNAGEQKIPMTTPVFMSGSATNATMAFVMPQDMTVDATPAPKNPRVSMDAMAAGKFAVLRFSGRRNADNETNALAALNAWMKGENLQPSGEPVFGYFDPPWTPSGLRRNEVMLRIAP
jgi:DNA gyrase inhibitor GyrI